MGAKTQRHKEMDCPHQPCCSPAPLDPHESIQFFKEMGIPYTIYEGKKTGWRTRSKLAVRNEEGKTKIGLFFPGTHEVFEIPQCPAHHPRINEAVSLISSWMKESSIEGYQEKEHRGLLRYLQLVVERSTNRVQGSFVVNSPKIDLPFSRLIEKSPAHFWHSLWVNFNPKKGNTIFSQDWKRYYGEEWLVEEIAGIPSCYLPGSFGQANLEMFEKLIISLKQKIPPNLRVTEFYAGGGVIGAAIADKCQSVTLNEINPDSKKCFDEMQRRLPDFLAKKLTYYLGQATSALDLIKKRDLVIVDPPRKGLDLSLIKELKGVSQLVYISCGFDSFKRDLSLLHNLGLTLRHVEGYSFFPGTSHIELLAFFSL